MLFLLSVVLVVLLLVLLMVLAILAAATVVLILALKSTLHNSLRARRVSGQNVSPDI